MPRLSPSLISRARHIHPFLPLLLRTCRDIPSARNELRWLRDYVSRLRNTHRALTRGHPPPTLLQLCKERALGKPLQYVLGDQPFGSLDIKCQRGVLIPRPETEEYTIQLAELLVAHAAPFFKRPNQPSGPPPPPSFRILDLCTGSGCIALLLHALLAPHFPRLSILGLDLSERALHLAKRNLRSNVLQGRLSKRALQEVDFERGDVLKMDTDLCINGTTFDESVSGGASFDLVVSNPPYISEKMFWRETERSVRNWEPRMALVPPPMKATRVEDAHATRFYGPIARIASAAGARLLLIEVGEVEQVEEVASALLPNRPSAQGEMPRSWSGFEVWCNGLTDSMGSDREVGIRSHQPSSDGSLSKFQYRAVGSGKDRAVIAWRGEGTRWLGK